MTMDITVEIVGLDLDPNADFEVNTRVKMGERTIEAEHTIYRDEDAGTESVFFEYAHDTYQVAHLSDDEKDAIVGAMETVVWEIQGRLNEIRERLVEEAINRVVKATVPA
jgi:hypothetical protein